MTFGWHLESIGIDFHLECVGMAHEMCWNVLEWPMEWAGMGWNGLEWPLESGGMNLKSVGMEYHLDSIRIRQNDRFRPFQQIPDGIPTFQSESTGVRRKPWGRVKYWSSNKLDHIDHNLHLYHFINVLSTLREMDCKYISLFSFILFYLFYRCLQDSDFTM